MTPEEQLYEELTLNVEVDEFGTKRWKNAEGKLHRIYGPAIEFIDGDKIWYQNGLPHREDGPAIEWKTGQKAWYKNGKIEAFNF